MTRARSENPCDFRISNSKEHNCKVDEMNYSIQFSQKAVYGLGKKGTIVSSKNRADMCKACFLKAVENSNYKIEWEAIVKQADNTWKKEALEPQKVL
jgi:hypothetical protein